MNGTNEQRPLAGIRIAVVTGRHHVMDERITLKQAVSLQKLGAEVTVVAADNPGDKAPPGLKFLDLGGLYKRNLMNLLKLPRLARQAVRTGAQVYFCHEPDSAFFGLIARLFSGAKVVFDSHEFWEEGISHRIGGWRGKLLRRTILWLLRRVGKRANWVTVVSPPMRDFYRAMRKDDHVDIIYNSPNMGHFPPCDQSDRDEIVVCHEGRIDLGRGITQMLDALAIARKEAKIRLLLIGWLEPNAKEMFPKKVESLGLSDCVELTFLPYDRVGEAMARAQVGVVALQPTPNNYKGLGNKIFHYMCGGLACVAPAGSTTADLVRQVDCGLAVDTTNPQEIAKAWVTLARDGELRRRLGANGRKAVEQEYGWHRMEEKLTQIVHSLVDKKTDSLWT